MTGGIGPFSQRHPSPSTDAGARRSWHAHRPFAKLRDPKEIDMTPLESLVACGTKLWLDSVDPELVLRDRALGATGATSNPIIVADLVKTGRFDGPLKELLKQGLEDEAIAWRLTDGLVREAQEVFLPAWEQSRGNDGYVSFELDPLLEDPACTLSHPQKVARYVELGRQ